MEGKQGGTFRTGKEMKQGQDETRISETRLRTGKGMKQG